MDHLSSLPTKDHDDMSSHEKNTMQRFFGGGTESSTPSKSKPSTLKLIGYATVLFVLLANPYIDGILCHVPYCEDNEMVLFLFKTLLFALLFFMIYYFFV
jgi:hypothetical protein